MTSKSSSKSPDTGARTLALEEQLRTTQNRLERAENNERCFRQLAEHIREVFWMTNRAGDELVYISPAYEHIWGQTCNSLYDDPRRRLAWVHDIDRQRVLTAFKRDAVDGDYDETFRIDRPDGQIRWIRDRAFPVRDTDGDVYRLAGFAIDITEDKRAEDDDRTLQSRISSHDRLSVFGALGTGLAHDLSQPLTAARLGLAALHQMQSGNGHPESLETLGDAVEEIDRAIDIVKHMRDFARNGELNRRPHAVRPLIAAVNRVVDVSIRRHRIDLQLPTLPTGEEVELPLDPIFFQQVLSNLVMNAIEAISDNPDSDRRISVVLNEQHAEHVDVEVTDNGPGIAKLDRLFEPFHTTKQRGLGLGLAVSRSLARAQGGDLFVASERDPTRLVLRVARD